MTTELVDVIRVRYYEGEGFSISIGTVPGDMHQNVCSALGMVLAYLWAATFAVCGRVPTADERAVYLKAVAAYADDCLDSYLAGDTEMSKVEPFTELEP